ncbi:MAG: hypothetical protein AB8B96_16690 [Lysobacterales bacterium]
MNTIIATIILAASVNTNAETDLRDAASKELLQLQAQARTELNIAMTKDIHQQLKTGMEEQTASALIADSNVLLAGEPRKAKKK